MTKHFLITISIILTIVCLNNCRPVYKSANYNPAKMPKSPLAAYGEKIFKRESCESCHTLDIEKESLQLVSLDGFGGKYSDLWIYNYLLDPQIIIVGSQKNSYTNLYEQPLSKAAEKYKSWKKLLNEADLMAGNLKKAGQTSEKTEILALISFLQQIPASKKRAELDSIEHQKYLSKRIIWDELTLDNNSIIIKAAEDDTNIEKGKLLFNGYCSPCHGNEGQGIIGPNLTDEYWLHGGKKLDIARTIINGFPDKGMISWKYHLSPIEVGELVAFIYSIRGSNPVNAKPPQGNRD